MAGCNKQPKISHIMKRSFYTNFLIILSYAVSAEPQILLIAVKRNVHIRSDSTGLVAS